MRSTRHFLEEAGALEVLPAPLRDRVAVIVFLTGLILAAWVLAEALRLFVYCYYGFPV